MDLSLTPDLVRTLIFFSVYAVSFFSLEAIFAARRYETWMREGFWTDIAHFFVTRYFVDLMVGAFTFFILFQAMQAGYGDGIREAVTAWPLWLHFILLMLYWSFVSYWDHRLAHTWAWRWRFHAIHHTTKRMDWLVSTRLHPVDQAITRLVGFAPMLFVGIKVEAFLPFFAVAGIVALLNHSNIRWSMGPLNRVIATTHWHHWHHALEPQNKNFSNLIVIWDTIFGTYYCPKGEWPKEYGITEEIDENWFTHMAHPFRRNRTRQNVEEVPVSAE